MKPVVLSRLLDALQRLLALEWVLDDPTPRTLRQAGAPLKAVEVSDLLALGELDLLHGITSAWSRTPR